LTYFAVHDSNAVTTPYNLITKRIVIYCSPHRSGGKAARQKRKTETRRGMQKGKNNQDIT
jgi:hypothetical protein